MKRRTGLWLLVALFAVALVAARADARPRVAAATTVVLKIQVNKDGWYRVPASTISSAGFVPSNWNNVHLSTGGQEVPIQENAGTIDFYGLGLDPPTSADSFWVAASQIESTRTYWLSEDGTAGQRMQVLSAGGPTSPPGTDTFEAILKARDRQSYYSFYVNGPETTMDGPGNSFFSAGQIVQGTPMSRPITLSNADVGQAATLRVDLAGYQTVLYPGTSHSIDVSLNGTNLGPVSGSGSYALFGATFSVPSNVLVNGSNTILLTNPTAANAVNTDRFTLTYRHKFFADSDALEFPVTPGTARSVGGFSTNDVRVADISNPMSPRELLPTVSAGGSPFTIGVTPPAGATRLYAFTGAKVLSPLQVLQDSPSNLRSPTNQADLIVITHANFRSAIQPLVNQRRADGFAVLDVDVQDVFDEFGSSPGARDPESIRAFLEYAKNNWTGQMNPRPKYVLLVGDGSFDRRNFRGFGFGDFVPTIFVDAAFSPEPPSDDSLADFNGDGRPELAVGRLPVGTAAETTALVNKILNYATGPARPRTALLVSDNHDRNDYAFRSFSDDLQNTSLVPNGVSVTRVDRPDGATTASDTSARDQVIAQASAGPIFVNWFGHGRIHAWAGSPPLLQSSNAPSLTNAGALSLYLMMTCQNAYFIDPTFPSLGEALLKTANGAVAVWGSSGDTVPTDQVKSAKLATNELLRSGSYKRLGDALLFTKTNPSVTDIDVLHTWTLLGDPTMKLHIFSPTAVAVKSFRATRASRGVELRWRTAGESELIGFNVYRSAGGKTVKLNRGLIAAKYSGKTRGASYRLLDRLARRGGSYTYRLQLVSLSGKRSWAASTAIRRTR